MVHVTSINIDRKPKSWTVHAPQFSEVTRHKGKKRLQRRGGDQRGKRDFKGSKGREEKTESTAFEVAPWNGQQCALLDSYVWFYFFWADALK